MSDSPREDAEPEPAVEGEAVELTGEDTPAPPTRPAMPTPSAPTRASVPIPSAPTRASVPVPEAPPTAASEAPPTVPSAAPPTVASAPPPTVPSAPVMPPPTHPASAASTAEAVGSAFDGHAPEPPMNPLGDIASKRPEILVGAAFVGGILAAMILRRLGS